MRRGIQGALFAWALLACASPESAPLPGAAAASWLFAAFEGEVLSQLVAASDDQLPARGWTRPEGATLVLVPMPWSLAALQLEAGPVAIPDAQSEARALLPEVPIFLFREGDWVEAEDGQTWRARIRLPRFRPLDCVVRGGCLAPEWPYCQLDCPKVVVAPPAPPLAPKLPTIEAPTCGDGPIGFLSGRCVDLQESCAEAWPAEWVDRPEVIFADAAATPPGLGTASSPFSDLSAAITAAPDQGVVALRGSFEGNVVLRNRRLTLRGLCPSVSRLSTQTGTTVLLQGGETTLHALSIHGPLAVHADGGHHQGTLLQLVADEGLRIEGGEVETGTVVVKSTRASAIVNGGTWRGGDLELRVRGGDGVRISANATAQLSGVRIVATASARAPLYVTGALELSDAIVEGPFTSSSMTELGGRLTMNNVRLLAGGSHGLLAEPGSTLRLDTVEIANATVHGLLVRDSALSGADLWVHDIVGTGEGFGQGIVLDHNQAQLLERVRIENVVEGLLVDPPAKPATGLVTLRDVEISDCKTYGVTLQGGLDQPVAFLLERARIRRAGLDGLRLRRFSVPVVTDVWVEDVGVEGIDVSSDYAVQLSRAKIQRTGAACYKSNLSQTFPVQIARHTIEDLDLSEPGVAGGTPIGLYLLRGSFTFRRVQVARSSVGILAQGTIETRVEGAELVGNEVGMDLSAVADDLPLLTGVYFDGNETNLVE